MALESPRNLCAYSSDFNPLDFNFWALAQGQIYATKPSTVDELINVVKQYSAKCSEEVQKFFDFKILRRVRVCVQQCEDHFQHLLR